MGTILKSLGAVRIFVGDLDRARRFYREVLELREKSAAPDWAMSDIDARGQGKGPLGDDELLGLLQKMIKQRHESIELYEKGARPELAKQERDEIAIIAAYLPTQMSEDDVKAAIAEAIRDTGAAGM